MREELKMQKEIIPIPQTKRLFDYQGGIGSRRRVAAYARVSTDLEEQFTSYEAQIDYYTKYIGARADWEFVDVYTDEGITGTSVKKRDGFRNMIADAKAGKIDLIITKSVSRFARNTVDSLTTIRELKEYDVEIYFEKENIWTFDSKGELLITIMSSLAQEESRSISENTAWGRRKQFSDGKFSVAYSTFLGYEKGPDGTLVVNEEEAKVVRKIYGLFLEGNNPTKIARMLQELGYKSPMGRKTWHPGTVRSILTNEKYKGDALLQKGYTEDFLTKKYVKNQGELQQFYVKNSHEAIIDPVVFDFVQMEMKRKKKGSGRLFSGKVICGDCGGYYGPKVWNSTDKYRKVIYQCNDKYGKRHKGLEEKETADQEIMDRDTADQEKRSFCQTPHKTEEELKEAVIKKMNILFARRDRIVETFEQIHGTVFSTDSLEERRDQLETSKDKIQNSIDSLIRKNAAQALDQEEYQREYDRLFDKLEKKMAALEIVKGEIYEKRLRKMKAEEFMELLQNQIKEKAEPINEFDEELFRKTVDHLTVHRDGQIKVTFKDGTEL